jgi:hypothetical protein
MRDLAEMRNHTAHRGMLDGLIDIMNKIVFPNHLKFGIPVIGLWTDRSRNDIVWIRSLDSPDTQKRLGEYETSSQRKDALPLAAYHLAKPPEFRILHNVFKPADAPDVAARGGELADKARAVFAARTL